MQNELIKGEFESENCPVPEMRKTKQICVLAVRDDFRNWFTQAA